MHRRTQEPSPPGPARRWTGHEKPEGKELNRARLLPARAFISGEPCHWGTQAQAEDGYIAKVRRGFIIRRDRCCSRLLERNGRVQAQSCAQGSGIQARSSEGVARFRE